MVVSKIFLCSSRTLGKMIQFDEHIFQRGWFNHQLERIMGSINSINGTHFLGKVIKLDANEWQFWRDFHLRVTLPIRWRIPECYMASITLDTYFWQGLESKSKGGLKVMFRLSLWWFLGSFALGFSYHFPFLEHIPFKGTLNSIDVLWDDHPTHHEEVSGKMKVQTDVFLVYAYGVCKGNPPK